jgi:hypothetical protein
MLRLERNEEYMALSKFKSAVTVRLAGTALAGTAGLMAFTGLTASPAEAAQGWKVVTGSGAECKGGGDYCLFYASGAFTNNNPEWSFNQGAPNLGQWVFDLCAQGGNGSCGAGYNMVIRNNAASIASVGCAGTTVWYSTNYTGNWNWTPNDHWGNLNSYLVNNEASAGRGTLC